MPKKAAFENIMGKEENAGNRHFLHFPQCFLPFPQQISTFQSNLFLWSANAFDLDQSKILSFGNGVRRVMNRDPANDKCWLSKLSKLKSVW